MRFVVILRFAGCAREEEGYRGRWPRDLRTRSWSHGAIAASLLLFPPASQLPARILEALLLSFQPRFCLDPNMLPFEKVPVLLTLLQELNLSFKSCLHGAPEHGDFWKSPMSKPCHSAAMTISI